MKEVSGAVKRAIHTALQLVGLGYEDFVSEGRIPQVVAGRFAVLALCYRNTNGRGCMTSWPELAAAQNRVQHSGPLTRHHANEWVFNTAEWRTLEQEWVEIWSGKLVRMPSPSARLVVEVLVAGKDAYRMPDRLHPSNVNGVARALATWSQPVVEGLGQFSVEFSGGKAVGVKFMACRALMEAIGARTAEVPPPQPLADGRESTNGTLHTSRGCSPDPSPILPAPSAALHGDGQPVHHSGHRPSEWLPGSTSVPQSPPASDRTPDSGGSGQETTSV